MPVTILCPSCLQATEVQAAPIGPCPRCNAILPEPVRRATIEALEAQYANVPKPLGVRILVGYFGLAVVVLLMIAVIALVSVNGSYTINGEAVTQEEFISRAGPWIVAFAFVSAGLCWGFLKERRWARPALLVTTTLLGLGSVTTTARGAGAGVLILAITPWGLLLAAAYWYLYRRANVVAYFRRADSRGNEVGR